MRLLLLFGCLLLTSSCSPLRSSPSDGQHVFELNLHEVQTNLDDLRHDINCFQTELQILEGRIKSHESALASLRQNELEKQQLTLDQIQKKIQSFEKVWNSYEKEQNGDNQKLKQLAAFAAETSAALAQFKDRIGEMEHEILGQNRRFEEWAKLKGSVELGSKSQKGETAKLYRVKQGDTLKKIAALHETSVEKIKEFNHLDTDTIVIGQQLKIPSSHG